MKKLFSLLLVCSLVMSTFVTVMAEGETPAEPVNLFAAWGDFENENVQKVTAEGTEYISNYGGYITVAEEYITGEQQLYMTLEDGIGKDSSKGLRMYVPADYSPKINANVETGAVYRLSFEAKKGSNSGQNIGLCTYGNEGVAAGNYHVVYGAGGEISALENAEVANPNYQNTFGMLQTSGSWSTITADFYIPDSESETIDVSFGLGVRTRARSFYLDNISLVKVGDVDLVVDGEESIAIPAAGTDKTDRNQLTKTYSAKVKVGDLDFTTALGVEPQLSIEGEAPTGVVYNAGTLTVDNTAQIGTIVLNATSAAVADKILAKTKTKTVQLTYPSEEPEIRYLLLDGTVEANSTLTASFSYYDPSGEKPIIDAEIEWYGTNSDEEVKDWHEITPTAPLENVGNDYETTLTIGETVQYKEIKCQVVATYSGGSKTAESNSLVGPVAPEVRNLNVTVSALDEEHPFFGNPLAGNVRMGETLTASYTWFDSNDRDELNKGVDVIQWYRLDSAQVGAARTPIEGATSLTYTPTADDVDKFIQFGVIAKSTVEPCGNTEVFSEIFAGPQRPVAQNVSITKSKSGNVLTANYDYTHPQNINEATTTFAWYMGSRLVSTTAQYTVPSNTTGNVYVIVTPFAELEPAEGAPVTSASVSVNTKSQGGNGGNTGISTPAGSFGNVAGTKPSGNGTIVGGDDVTVDEAPTATAGSSFSDVQNHWAKDQIEELVKAGILKGVDEDSFAPDSKVTRAEFCTMIYRALGLTATGGGQKFGDVSSDKWYYESVQAVAEKGIINGDGQNFNPEKEMNRQEMAKVIWAAISDKVIKPTVQAGAYSDAAQVSDWAKDAINSLSVYKVLEGSDGQFRPLANMTRAEAAAVISRVLRLINGGK